MSEFAGPPGHSGASTSTASASREPPPPPPVQDQQGNSKKRPREEDYPWLWGLDSFSEDALQGQADLQDLPQPLQQACKRRRLLLELKSFEKFIQNFIKCRRFIASKGNTNPPAEGKCLSSAPFVSSPVSITSSSRHIL